MSRLRLSLLPVPLLLLPLLSCGGIATRRGREILSRRNECKTAVLAASIRWSDEGGGSVGREGRGRWPDSYDVTAEHNQFSEVLKQKPTGILVSASDPNLIKGDIDAAIAQGVAVITIDSDAPASKRLMFIGTDNYKAGVLGAGLAAQATQSRGAVVVYSMPEQNNLKERLRGYKDIFESHPQIKIAEVVDVKGDPRIAFDKTTELIEKSAKVDAFVCLVSFACKEVADVLDRKHVTGKVVVAMDTDEATLAGIQKGLISATIAQKPFTMAFIGLKLLDDLHHHPLSSLTKTWSQDSFSPIPTFVDTGVTLIDQRNVDQFIQARNSATGK